MLAAQEGMELETEPGLLGARNSQECLEMIWEKKKKIKNPSETHLFLYMVVVAIWGKKKTQHNTFIQSITVCGE